MNWRLHWFFYNLIRFIVGIPFFPFYFIMILFMQIRIVFTTDGSEELCWPWEWEWREEK